MIFFELQTKAGKHFHTYEKTYPRRRQIEWQECCVSSFWSGAWLVLFESWHTNLMLILTVWVLLFIRAQLNRTHLACLKPLFLINFRSMGVIIRNNRIRLVPPFLLSAFFFVFDLKNVKNQILNQIKFLHHTFHPVLPSLFQKLFILINSRPSYGPSVNGVHTCAPAAKLIVIAAVKRSLAKWDTLEWVAFKQ